MALNCGSSMKWYSRPCCSWPRGARVVCDTDTARCESSSSSAFTRLDLPVPLGAATTKRLPGVCMLRVDLTGAAAAPMRLGSLAALLCRAAVARNCRQCGMRRSEQPAPAAAAPQILALGEPMVEFNCTGAGDGRLYLQGFGGDTSNFAIAAARQGARVGCLGALGDDANGRMLRALWDAKAWTTATCAAMPPPTPRSTSSRHGARGHEFSFFRQGSAASRMRPADLPRARIEAARVLHLSGITLAISDSSCDTAYAAIDIARAAGVRRQLRHQPAAQAVAAGARPRADR